MCVPRSRPTCFGVKGLSDGAGVPQDLFKCKPAIMRAFQAARGVHKVRPRPHEALRVCVDVGDLRRGLHLGRAGAAGMTTT